MSELQSPTPKSSTPFDVALPSIQSKALASRAQEVSATLDVTNVLLEGMSRTQQPQKEAYTAAFETASQGKLDAFHHAFSVFIAASTYYFTKTPLVDTVVSSNNIAPQLHCDTLSPEPQYYHQMLRHPHADGFKQAMKVEIEALQKKNTWKKVLYDSATQANKTLIPTMWAFKYKFNNEGFFTKYKAHLCARGDLQHTAQDTFAATLAARVFFVLMAIMAAYDWETRQYDAVNAFANSEIDKPTYFKPPDRWTISDKILLLLLQALYGLKQSPALWYRDLSQTLNDLGLELVAGVEYLFTNDFMLFFLFVDDIVVLFDQKNTTLVDTFQAQLFNKYEMQSLGELKWFLGIQITRERETRHLWFCQDSYIDKLSAKFKVLIENKCPRASLPFEELTKSTTTASPQKIHAYQQRVGSINFAAVITRPDIAHAASKLSEFLTNPSKFHLNCANRVLLYLVHTRELSIKFDTQIVDSQRIFLASSDASFANDPNTCQSSQGYTFMLFNGAIDWKTSKQRTVTTSSTEAELLAFLTAGKELIWWNCFFDSIDFNPGHKTHIQCNNMQTIRAFTADTPKFTTKMRHFNIHRH